MLPGVKTALPYTGSTVACQRILHMTEIQFHRNKINIPTGCQRSLSHHDSVCATTINCLFDQLNVTNEMC
jgi:hypothetical protein